MTGILSSFPSLGASNTTPLTPALSRGEREKDGPLSPRERVRVRAESRAPSVVLGALDRPVVFGGSVLGQVGGRAFGVDLSGDAVGPLEHHLQLAGDGDELPALGDPALGVGGGLDVEAAGEFLSVGGFADPGEGLLHELLA